MTGRIALDRSVRVLDRGRTLLGGDPPRALRLSPAGARALGELCGDDDDRGADGENRRGRGDLETLRRKLIADGLAHPRPVASPAADVTVVVPVRDRAVALHRCLAALNGARALVVDDGSADPRAVAAVCRRHGGRLIRRQTPGGPGVARNTALALVDSELVAFLDSDCVPEPGWLELLAGALVDPAVGAAAPRLVPADPAVGGPVARFAAARSPLDLGAAAARVAPGGRVSYLPTAALLVRRCAIATGFDPGMRYGEDVDLVWRLYDAGWQIRYEPTAIVRHAEPERWRSLAARRFRYGTSAAPLARRHPTRLAPVVVHPRPAVGLGLLAAGRPRLAALAFTVHAGATTRRLRRLGVSPRVAAGLAARGVGDTSVALGRASTMLAPVLLGAGLLAPGGRRPATALLLAAPLSDWIRRRPDLDPVRWTLLSVADDIAYGAGVWAGALRERTSIPLRPIIMWRSPRPSTVPG